MRFVLIHGAWHGAWCWEKLVPELEALGHEAVAVDLPGHGLRQNERATVGSYRQAAAEVIEEGDVLVGHSMGGYVMTLGADAVPAKVSRMIFLAAGLPVEGKSMLDTFPGGGTVPGIDQYIETVESGINGPCMAFHSFPGACELLYHDCTDDDQRWAFEHLSPQPIAPLTAPIRLPNFWKHNIPASFILCTDDRGHPAPLVADVLRRRGLSTCIGIDASHSPFISRPRETAHAIDLCAQGLVEPPPGPRTAARR